MSRVVETSDRFEFNPDVVGWNDEHKEVILVAPTRHIQELWRKKFPGIRVELSQKLPEALPSGKGIEGQTEPLPTESEGMDAQ